MPRARILVQAGKPFNQDGMDLLSKPVVRKSSLGWTVRRGAAEEQFPDWESAIRYATTGHRPTTTKLLSGMPGPRRRVSSETATDIDIRQAWINEGIVAVPS